MNTLRINRREFVALSTTAAAGLAIGLPAFGAEAVTSFVSIGYRPWTPRRRATAPERDAAVGFVDARSILTADPRFLRHGARFRLHNFHRTGKGAQRIEVIVQFHSFELAEPAPFHAFSSVRTARGDMTSNPIGFNVPVEADRTVDLLLRRQSAGAPADDAALRFAINDGAADAIRLNEGIYALAFLGPTQPAPSWNAIRLDAPVSRGARNQVSLLDGSVPLPFDYLLLSVTRAVPKRGEPGHSEDLDLEEDAEL